MRRLIVLGLGAVGKRVATSAAADPRFSYRGAVVRGLTTAILAGRGGPYYAWDEAARTGLVAHEVPVAGLANDALALADVVADCGQGGSGAGRLARYSEARLPAVFCGGERNDDLGRLVMPPRLPPVGARARVPSCNTTALARVLLPLLDLARGDLRGAATIIKCATDADKASKGSPTGLRAIPHHSHHGRDLQELDTRLQITTSSYAAPMITGHVIDLWLPGTTNGVDIIGRLAPEPGLRLRNDDHLDTLADRAGRASGTPLVDVRVFPGGPGTRLVLHLDNETVTVPEILDAASRVEFA